VRKEVIEGVNKDYYRSNHLTNNYVCLLYLLCIIFHFQKLKLMIKTITYTLCLLAFSVCVAYSKFFFSSQPPQGHTGAEGQTCTNCHGGNALNSGGGSVTATGLPTGGYVPGQAYNFSINISHGAANRNKWGFSIAARNSTGQTVGTFSDANPNAAPNGDELSHLNAATATNTRTFTYDSLTWTAPTTPNTQDNQVTFYYVGVAANGNFNSGGDFVYSGSTITALPITLSGFLADVKETTVTLKWQTASESNSSHFIIEKSADNQHFYPVTQINAAGNSSSARNYSYADEKPAYFETPTYYRLALMDKDGSKKYSTVVNISLKAVKTFVRKLYPNPIIRGSIMQAEIISNKQQRVTIQLISINGSKLQQYSTSLQKGNNIVDISVSKAIASGMYAVLVQTEDDVQQIPVLIK